MTVWMVLAAHSNEWLGTFGDRDVAVGFARDYGGAWVVEDRLRMSKDDLEFPTLLNIVWRDDV